MSRKANKCPLCQMPQSADFKPFCSQGCKDRDLLKWLDEGYRVAGPPAEFADSMEGYDED
jgi:endogenous inhibitor of DNA gyrase (YacG/DUF329 family)